MLDFLAQYQNYFIGLSIFSIVLFIIGVIASPYLAGLIPQDYFTKSYQIKSTNLFIKLGKNMIGLMLLILGIIMLVTPGQGILTILLSLFLMDFRTKRRLELKLIQQDSIFQSLNWLRQKNNHPLLKRE